MSTSGISGPGNTRKTSGTEDLTATAKVDSTKAGKVTTPVAVSRVAASSTKNTTSLDPSQPSLEAPQTAFTPAEFLDSLSSLSDRLNQPALSPEQIIANKQNTANVQQVVSVVNDLQDIQNNTKLDPLEKTMQLMILMTKLNKIMGSLNADIIKNAFKDQVKADEKALQAAADRAEADRKASAADVGSKILGWCTAIGNLILAIVLEGLSGAGTVLSGGAATPAFAAATVYLASAIAGLGMQIAIEASPEDAAAIGIAMIVVSLTAAILSTAITMGASSPALLKEVTEITKVTEQVVEAAKTTEQVVGTAMTAAGEIGAKAADAGTKLAEATQKAAEAMQYAEMAAEGAKSGKDLATVSDYALKAEQLAEQASTAVYKAGTSANQAVKAGTMTAQTLKEVNKSIDTVMLAVSKAEKMAELATKAKTLYENSPLWLKAAEVFHALEKGNAAIQIPGAAGKVGVESVKAQAEKEISGSEATKIEGEKITQSIQNVSESISEIIKNLQKTLNQIIQSLSGQIQSNTQSLASMLGNLKA